MPGLIRLTDTIVAVALAAVLYYVVITSQFGRDPLRWRAVLSTVLTILMLASVLMHATWVLFPS